MGAPGAPDGPGRVTGIRGWMLKSVEFGKADESWVFSPSLSTRGPRDEKALALRGKALAHQIAASGALYDALKDAAEILAEMYPGFIEYSEPYNRGIEARDAAVAKALAALALARGESS